MSPVAQTARRKTGSSVRFLILLVTGTVVPLMAWTLAYAPHLLLRVPRIGFLLYAMAGGTLPPYFNHDVFDEPVAREWMRKGDVFIATCGKCGSTWLMNIVHEIRSKGSPKPFSDIYLEVPFPEVVFYPGQPLSERVEWLKNNSSKHPFAAYKTHYFPPALEIRKDAKYIVGIRNFVDATASLEPFIRDHGVAFANMWGGFPPQAGVAPTMTSAEAYEKYVMDDMGSGHSELDAFLVSVIAAWWPYRNEPNILFTHYSDRASHSREGIQEIVKFLEVDLTEEELQGVVEHTSFKEMKKNSDRFNLRHIFDDFKLSKKMPNNIEFLSGDLIVSGPSRDGSKDLSKRLVQRIDEKLDQIFGPQIAQWIRTGGPIPDVDLPKQGAR